MIKETKDTQTSLLPRRRGNKLLRKFSYAIRDRIFDYDQPQYSGGEEDASDQILILSELFICLYQFIGQCYYVSCAFYYKGFTPFAAQVLVGAISFAMDVVVDLQQK